MSEGTADLPSAYGPDEEAADGGAWMSGARWLTRLAGPLTKAFSQRQRKQRSQDALRASPSPPESTSEFSAAAVHFHNDSERG